jgi:hypothetical protein
MQLPQWAAAAVCPALACFLMGIHTGPESSERSHISVAGSCRRHSRLAPAEEVPPSSCSCPCGSGSAAPITLLPLLAAARGRLAGGWLCSAGVLACSAAPAASDSPPAAPACSQYAAASSSSSAWCSGYFSGCRKLRNLRMAAQTHPRLTHQHLPEKLCVQKAALCDACRRSTDSKALTCALIAHLHCCDVCHGHN